MPLFRGDIDQALSTLIAAIYDAALDPAKWQVFVDALSEVTSGIEPVFYLADSKTAIMETLLVSQDWGTTFLDEYMAYYNACNPWTPGLVSAPAVGRPISGEQIISEHAFRRTEFWNDFFKKYWDWSSVVGVVNYRDAHSFSVLGLHCTAKMFDRDRAQLTQLAGRLSPHITRAFEISRQLHHGRARSASLELMLHELHNPALIITPWFRVRYANPAADAIFASGVLSLDSQACVAAGARGRETNALRAALTAALDPIQSTPGPAVVRLTRPSADDHANALPLLARIMPLGRPRLDDNLSPPVPHLFAESEALILITDPAARRPLRARKLRQLFGLTPTETRLAQALAQGISLQGYAQAAGIADGTARVQLKSVFSKTNTHRQAELVALLARLTDPFKLGD